MTHPRDPLETLTSRETEVLALLREGLTNAQIAERLGISLAGVRYHVSEIISKLGVRNRHEAAAWPERPPWWVGALAPALGLWRWMRDALPLRLNVVAGVVAAVVFVALLGGLTTLLVFLLDTERDAARQDMAVLVYVRNDELWAASLDGRMLPPRRISSGGTAAYAGFARRPDGGLDLYYTRELGEPRTDDVRVQDLDLYRVPLERGDPTEVLRFTGPAFVGGAAVSPDARHVVYTDVDGLVLRDLASGEGVLLAANRRVIAGDGSVLLTDVLAAPQWTPDGEAVHVLKYIGPDFVPSVVLRPFASPPEIVDLGYEGYSATWSPHGDQLCIWGSEIGSEAGLYAYDVATAGTVDLLRVTALPTPPSLSPPSVAGCAWAGDGRLAFAYPRGRVVVLDAEGAEIARSSPASGATVVGWLPDGSGVVVNRSAHLGEQRARAPGVFRPETGGFTSLPFQADRVVAVLSTAR